MLHLAIHQTYLHLFKIKPPFFMIYFIYAYLMCTKTTHQIGEQPPKRVTPSIVKSVTIKRNNRQHKLNRTMELIGKSANWCEQILSAHWWSTPIDGNMITMPLNVRMDECTNIRESEKCYIGRKKCRQFLVNNEETFSRTSVRHLLNVH